jgi:photoactive yellow protein
MSTSSSSIGCAPAPVCKPRSAAAALMQVKPTVMLRVSFVPWSLLIARVSEHPARMMNAGAYRALAAQIGVAPEDFPEPLYVVDPLGRVMFCNRAMAELVGLTASEIVGKLSIVFYRPEATPAFLMRRTQALMGRTVPPKFRTELRRSGGARLPVELSVTNLGNEGRVIGRVAIVRPVEQAARVERPSGPPPVESLLQLTQEETDALPYGVIVLDRSGVVVGYNAAESRLSGLSPTQVLGRNFFVEIAPCTRVRTFGGLYRRMVRTGEPAMAQFEFSFRFSFGEKRVFIQLAYSQERSRGLIVVEQR